MKLLRRIIFSIFLVLIANSGLIFLHSHAFSWIWKAAAFTLFLLINLFPLNPPNATRQIRILSAGSELLKLFCISAGMTAVIQLTVITTLFIKFYTGLANMPLHTLLTISILSILWAFFCEAGIFWNGMIRVYLTSVQLGIRHRILAALCGWIPILNLWYLHKIIVCIDLEVEMETEKYELSKIRAESEICKTKYPLLLVHGVFFRDFRYLNYWGRIPKELQRNGARIFYGQQQSAASVEDCGAELAARIKEIVNKTGCGKVNIIAHSKGGLDSRAAISHYGAAPYVASLTTINTPHRGCIFAEYLLKKIPPKAQERVAQAYNTALHQFGDPDPDFMTAVSDLTETACIKRNARTPDVPGIRYESIMSYCNNARSGKFPLNISYPLVNHFDGKNDGLVSVESAQWGSHFTLLEPTGRRGISHGDMIDLNRENIPGFDVREFYVQTVARLKKLGL